MILTNRLACFFLGHKSETKRDFNPIISPTILPCKIDATPYIRRPILAILQQNHMAACCMSLSRNQNDHLHPPIFGRKQPCSVLTAWPTCASEVHALSQSSSWTISRSFIIRMKRLTLNQFVAFSMLVRRHLTHHHLYRRLIAKTVRKT